MSWQIIVNLTVGEEEVLENEEEIVQNDEFKISDLLFWAILLFLIYPKI